MLSFIVLFLVSLISIFIFYFKGKFKTKVKAKKTKILKAVKNRLKGLRLFNGFLFTSNNSASFNFFKNLSSGLFVFENEKIFNDSKTLFFNSGLDLTLPVFKYEFYFDVKNYPKLQEFYNTLKIIKRVDDKNISFNFLVFYNNPKNYKPLQKLIKHFKFNFVKTRLYNCCEIDYKLLSILNNLDVNKKNNIIQKNKQIFFNNKLKRNINNNMIKNKLKSVSDQPIGFYLQKNTDKYYFESFKYSNYYESSFLEKNNFNAILNKTFNYKNNTQYFKLTIKNFTSTMQTYKVCFGIKLNTKTFKNTFYTVKQSSYKTCVINNFDEEKSINLIGNFKTQKLAEDYLLSSKNIKLKPFETINFYFALSKTGEYFSKEFLLNLDKSFENNWKNYSGLKLTKVLSPNKTLNYLLNEFLPQKIIEQTITNNCVTPDFFSLQNKTFDRANIDKSLFQKILKNCNFNLFFLIKNNLFKTYFNLLYFYLGIWQSSSGVYLNQDKSLIQNNSVVVCQTENDFFNLKISNTFNPLEVEINNIKFSNLKMLSYSMVQNKKDISLVF